VLRIFSQGASSNSGLKPLPLKTTGLILGAETGAFNEVARDSSNKARSVIPFFWHVPLRAKADDQKSVWLFSYG
jgi:hypothetical protein